MKINSTHTFKMCSIYIENNADIFIVYQFTIKKKNIPNKKSILYVTNPQKNDINNV